MVPQRKRKVNRTSLILFIILLLAFFFRFYKLTEWFSFGMDQEYEAFLVKNIVEGNHIPLIGVNAGERAEALQVAEHFKCKTVDLTESSVILMATGDTDKVDALVKMMGNYQIIELVRTGKVVMSRGNIET